MGHRYGPENADRVSFTELEYRHARRLGFDCYMFFASDNYLLELAHQEDDVKRCKLGAFKETVRGDVVPVTFDSPDELALKIFKAIRD